MNPPNSPYEEEVNVLPEWLEPFPQPQTIPSGWDVSEVLSASVSDVKDDTEEIVKG